MNEDRWVVLGLAHPRAAWFSELARWSTAAAVPVDFVKCVSPDEVRARLSGGRSFSALLVGGDVGGLDRDLIDTTVTTGAAVIVVDAMTNRDWRELGVSGHLPAQFERADLMAALDEYAPPISRVAPTIATDVVEPDIGWRGRLVAVTGAGGTGSSTAAMALAQAIGADASNRGLVALADLALNADLAMLHDTQEVIPGLQELTEAHRRGRLSIADVRDLVFDVPDRGYHLLLGLRRHRDWTVLRPRALEASIDALLRAYRVVVADVDIDIEGEEETGSIDVEDRNSLSRTTLRQADLVIVVGTATTKGIHSLARNLRELTAFGIDAERLVPVVNRVPRSRRRRAESADALAKLASVEDNANPAVLVPQRRDLEMALRDGVPLPPSLGKSLYAEVQARLDRIPRRLSAVIAEPLAVVPGSLGSWTQDSE